MVCYSLGFLRVDTENEFGTQDVCHRRAPMEGMGQSRMDQSKKLNGRAGSMHPGPQDWSPGVGLSASARLLNPYLTPSPALCQHPPATGQPCLPRGDRGCTRPHLCQSEAPRGPSPDSILIFKYGYHTEAGLGLSH